MTVQTTITNQFIIQQYVFTGNDFEVNSIIFGNRYDFDLKVMNLKKENANFTLYQKTITEDEFGHKNVKSVLLGQN